MVLPNVFGPPSTLVDFKDRGSGCDQFPGLKGKTGVSQQQLLLAIGVFIFTKCGLGTRVKKNGVTPIQSVFKGVVFL